MKFTFTLNSKNLFRLFFLSFGYIATKICFSQSLLQTLIYNHKQFKIFCTKHDFFVMHNFLLANEKLLLRAVIVEDAVASTKANKIKYIF